MYETGASSDWRTSDSAWWSYRVRRGHGVNIGYFQAAAIVLNLNQSYTVYDNQRVLILNNHLRGLRGNNTILTITTNHIN